MIWNETVEYLKLSPRDEPFLKEMLFTALFIPPGEPMLPKNVIEQPELNKYYLNWGREGDIGILAKVDELAVGACWSRLHPTDNPGYGFVDAAIPELTVAVKEEWRNRGLGRKMLELLCEYNKLSDYNSISLSVDKRNRVVELYKRLGFEILDEKGTAYTMLKPL